MKRIKEFLGEMKGTAVVMALSLATAVVVGCGDSAVAKKEEAKPKTSILPAEWGINDILMWVVKFLLYGLGVVAVLGTIIAGIMYLTARDNEQQVAKAKKRFFEIAVGLVAWAMMFTLLSWLIPGFKPDKVLN